MALNNTDIDKIAHLARLQIEDADISDYVRDLSDILGFVEQMNDVDTAEVEPMAHPFDAVQRLRQDIVTEEDQREAFQSIAPATENGLYLVPKVIE
jgi:aspartyl-tRNA(Asn)/glutamyl-tRNA(Gln) amidotransferase subunit C